MINYPTYDKVIDVHDDTIRRTGGLTGVLDDNLLHSCVEMIRNDDYYPDMESKTTHLVFSLVKNHGFRDGNKRTALAASTYFLTLNNIPEYYLNEYNRIMERVILHVANNTVNKNELSEAIADLINFGELGLESQLYYNRPLPDEECS